MRHHVIGIVRAGTVEPKPSERFSLEGLAREDAIRPVRLAGHTLEHSIDVLRLHGPLLSPRRVEQSALADDKLVSAESGDVVLRNVVAERPEKLRDDDLGTGRHPEVARRIEL